ncbi:MULTISPECIES: interleukin-like EMT inducer domain-containing protein [Paenibacillus]|uniref:ILEI/PANDER domain-containing protein n=1 Tax=Paenibacillus xylanilyticus TaxID=248903 RepID=A0A7Y6BTP1_9BACL|nr:MULTISPECIES: interleukin-like EMT inducer domain-containing protein [Paenibacillus]MBE7681610.1 hypothetical protein [Paenibacillus sp. P13VS]NUU74833.1 hypothetical protein [Paenibacillus xylanilyticus]
MNVELDFSNLDDGAIYIPASVYTKNQISLTYAAYISEFYRKNKIWIGNFSMLNLETNRNPIFFYSSIYIPQFNRYDYNVELAQGKSLPQYLEEVEIGSYVIISIKDDGSQQIKEITLEEVKKLGITLIDKSKLRCSYIWLARKTDEASYEVLHEECSPEELSWEGQVGGENILIKSGGSNAGNYSSIMINDVEKSMNLRGMNIVSWKEVTEISTTNCDTFSTIYMQGSLFKAIPPNLRYSNNHFSVVSRAGGKFQGVNYTNCKEAIEWNYKVRGHRNFEIDLELTSDQELVARLDWQAYLYGHLMQQRPDGIKEKQPLSSEQFKELKVLNEYTPLTITDIYELMVSTPDVYLITDTKYLEPETIKKQFKRIVTAAEPNRCEVLMRIVPQIYSEEMYSIIEGIFPFPNYIYSLYATQSSDDEIIRFVEGKPIGAVTMFPDRYTSDFGRKLKSLGVEVVLHTINDMEHVKKYVAMNVGGFYTDSLSSIDIESEIIRYQSEVKAIRDMLLLYIEKRFGPISSSVINILLKYSKQELEEFAPKLFPINTLEEFHLLCEEVKST